MSYRDDAVKRAFEIYNHGVYYAWGGGHATFFEKSGLWGIDCSGFTSAVAFGYTGKTVNKSWVSGDFRAAGQKGFNGIQIGDILFRSGHVGVYMGDKVLEASTSHNWDSTTNSRGWNYKPVNWSKWNGYYKISNDSLTINLDDYGITETQTPPNFETSQEDNQGGTQQGDSNEMREAIYLFLILTRYTKDKKKSYKRSRLL